MRVDGMKIKCLMAEKQIGMVATAEGCGMTHKTLKRTVEGCDVSFATVGKLAKFFEVHPEDIVKKDDSESTWR